MKFLLLFLTVLYCTALSSLAQNISFFGVVRDSLNNPIAFANVMAVDPATKSISSFGVTDGEGRFKLNLKNGQSYLLKVFYLGFVPVEKEITAADNSQNPLRVNMQAIAIELNPAEVIYEMPVTMAGDTISYKADAFVNGRERKLKDILEKLPGFEVDENGEVKVQGQKVNKLMVDGKDFFDGDTKMGTKNIPANAVDRVQVLKDFNEISPMKGLDNDENLALNIQLKEGKKNMVFGDLTAGGGPESRYLAHANVFYYSPKTSVNLIADANNVGELAFTMQDYFRFSGGLSSLSARSGSNMVLTSDDIGIPMAQRNNAIDLRTKLGALNYSYRPDKKWYHSGFIIGSESNNLSGSNSYRTYIRTDENNQETLLSSNQVNQLSGLLKYAATYTPSKDIYMKYSLFGKLAHNDNTSSQLSIFRDFENSILTQNRQNPFSLEHQLQIFHTPNERNVYSLEANYQYKNQDPFMDLMTSERPFNGIIPVFDQEVFSLLQAKKIITQKQESLFNYYKILNPKNHLNFTLGNSWTGQEMRSDIQQLVQETGHLNFDQPDLRNDVRYDFNDAFAGVSIKSKFKKLIASPGVHLHYYRLRDWQNGQDNLLEKVLLLPSLYAKYQFKSSQSLTLNYSTVAEFMDIQKLAEGLVIRDYNALFSGNRNLENGLYQRYNLNYNHFNMFSAYTIFGSVNYQRKMNDLVNTVSFVGLDRINSLVNVENINEALTGMLQGDKRFNAFKVRGSANLSALKTHNFVNERPNLNTTFTQNYTGSVTSTIFQKLDMELGYSLVYNDYRSDEIRNKFVTDRPFAKITYAFIKNFVLTADYEYNRYQNKGMNTSSTFDFLNAALVYQKKGSPWEFKTSVFNAMNSQSIRRDSFNESLISTFEYFVQKRYLLFTVKYDL